MGTLVQKPFSELHDSSLYSSSYWCCTAHKMIIAGKAIITFSVKVFHLFVAENVERFSSNHSYLNFMPGFVK